MSKSCGATRRQPNLSKMIVNTATVIRDGLEQELPIDELVVGDLVKLSAGDMIPADVILFESRDFFRSTVRFDWRK